MAGSMAECSSVYIRGRPVAQEEVRCWDSTRLGALAGCCEHCPGCHIYGVQV